MIRSNYLDHSILCKVGTNQDGIPPTEGCMFFLHNTLPYPLPRKKHLVQPLLEHIEIMLTPVGRP